jgi:predicted Fe-Mo cluster-binding NifX family protein
MQLVATGKGGSGLASFFSCCLRLARFLLYVCGEDIVMKIAIPTFGDRVSPRFDCAQKFLVVTLTHGEVAERQELNATDWAPHDRINRLMSLGVDTVVCGGIDRWSTDSLLSVGIQVHGWVTGSIEETLRALRRDELPTGVGVLNHTESGGRRNRTRQRGGR